MDSRVLAAARNNARWCDGVCRSLGIETRVSDVAWVALSRTPPLYPDAVTLAPEASEAELVASVEDKPGCSMKDSFASLDLEPFGFRELFDARWIWREVGLGAPSGSLEWTVVETNEAFSEWARAAGLDTTLTAALLGDPTVRILAAYGPDGVAAGAAANRSGSVVGVSNVFAVSPPLGEVWAGVVDVVTRLFPSLPLVGYEHGDDLEAACGAGFAELGPLRVWLRA